MASNFYWSSCFCLPGVAITIMCYRTHTVTCMPLAVSDVLPLPLFCSSLACPLCPRPVPVKLSVSCPSVLERLGISTQISRKPTYQALKRHPKPSSIMVHLDQNPQWPWKYNISSKHTHFSVLKVVKKKQAQITLINMNKPCTKTMLWKCLRGCRPEFGLIPG